MKRLFIKLMLGITFLFLGTLQADAKMYILKPKPSTPSHHKIGMPAFRPVIADIDAETGELTVMFRTTINSAEISISQDGKMGSSVKMIISVPSMARLLSMTCLRTTKVTICF